MNLPSHLSPSNLAFIQMLAREKGVSADTIAGQLLNNHLRGLRFFDRRMPLGSDEWQLAFNRPTALVGLFIDAGVTHEHSYHFYKNEKEFEIGPETSAPFASILATPPLDFAGGVAHVGAILKINNLGDILPVPNQAEMVL